MKKSQSAGKAEFKALVKRKNEELRRSQTPTDEALARANARQEAQGRMFATIRGHILQTFGGQVPLHAIFLFPGPTTDYDALIFYDSDADIEACRVNGIEKALKDAM